MEALILWPLLGCVEGTLGTHSRKNCIARTRERNEERVALRVDLMAAVLAKSAAEKITAEAECVRVAGAERPDDGRRRLDVADEERDRSGRQVRHLTDMIAPGRVPPQLPQAAQATRQLPPQPVRGRLCAPGRAARLRRPTLHRRIRPPTSRHRWAQTA